MARYIDVDLLQEEFNRAQMSIHHHGREFSDAFYYHGELSTKWWRVEQMLGDIPTADVEEVVRCKDCKFRYTNTCFAKHETGDMDFCSCGAKMDGGEE